MIPANQLETTQYRNISVPILGLHLMVMFVTMAKFHNIGLFREDPPIKVRSIETLQIWKSTGLALSFEISDLCAVRV